MKVDTSNPWHVLQRETKFDCPYFQVRQDIVRHAGGNPRPYNSVRVKFFGVAVVAIDRGGRVTLVGQYRHVLERYTWEIPGGGAMAGADPLATAKSELKEEVGCTARYFKKVVQASASPGTTSEFGAGYVA